MTRPGTDESPDSPFRLGGILVEPALNRLSSQDRVLSLEPKVMRLLVCLASRPGEVVRQSEIRSAVWGDVHVVDGVLARAAYRLRSALAKAGADHVAVETIRGTGYRLVERPLESAGPPPAAERRRTFWQSPRLGWAAAAALVIGALLFAQRSEAPVAPRGERGTPEQASEAPVAQPAEPQRQAQSSAGDRGSIASSTGRSVAPKAPLAEPDGDTQPAPPSPSPEAPPAARHEGTASEIPSPAAGSRSHSRPAPAAPTPIADPS